MCILFFGDLRSALDAQGAHAVHAHLTHIHALVADLDHATLEVLLVEHVHLERGNRCRQCESEQQSAIRSIKCVSACFRQEEPPTL